MKKGIRVSEIDNKYVGVDCAQVMIPIENSLSIFNANDLTFYGRGYQENKIDNTFYIQDERKKQFPYHDTPYHWTRKNLFSKILYVNQLFDFNKPYIIINNGILYGCSAALVTYDKTYFIETFFEVDDKDVNIKKYIEKEKVYDFFGELINIKDGKKTYIVDTTGKHLNIIFDENERKQKGNELIELLKQKKMLDKFDEHDIWYHNGEYILEDKFLLPSDSPLYVIKLDGKEIQIKFVLLSSINEDIVKVMSFDIPVERYTLEQVNKIIENSESEKLKEPVFSKTLRRKKIKK